MVKDWTLNL